MRADDVTPPAEREDAAGRVEAREIRGHAILTLAGTGLGAVLVLVAEVIAIRFLGPRFYGFYALAFVLARIAGMAAAFGLRVSIVHFVPVYLHKGQSAHVLGTILAAIGVALIVGSALAFAVWNAAEWAATSVFSKPGAAPFIATAALLIPLFALLDVLSHVPRAFHRSLEQVMTRNVVPPAAFAVILLLLGAADAPPIAAVGAQVLAHVLAAGVGFAFVAVLLRRRIAAVRPHVPVKALWRYSVPVVTNDLLVLGLTWAGLLMLGVFAPAKVVGMYRVCIQIGQILYLFLNAVGLATGSRYSAYIAAGERRQLELVYTTGLRWLALTVVPLGMIVVFNARDILALFDPGFVVGETALRISIVGEAIAMCFGLAGVLLILGGRPGLEMRNGAVALASNLVFSLALIPRYGIEGAALAATLSFVIVSALRVVQVRRFAGVGAGVFRLLGVALISGGVAFAVSVIAAKGGLPSGSGAGALALRVVVMAILQGAALWILVGRGEEGPSLRKVLGMRQSLADEPPDV